MKLKIFSTQKTTTDNNGKKRKFTAYYTKMNLIVKGEESKGKQLKSVTVKFRKEVNTNGIKRGYLVINNPDNINAPFIYSIEKDEESGKDIYPCLWVRGYDEYVEVLRKHEQSDFDVDEKETSSTEINDVDNKDLPF